MTPHLTKVAKAMLRRVFVCGNAGYFHDEVVGENWGGRKHSLVVLEKQGLLRSSRAKAPPRLLWHLTPDGAQVAQKLWCPGESADRAPEAAAPQPPSWFLSPSRRLRPRAWHRPPGQRWRRRPMTLRRWTATRCAWPRRGQTIRPRWYARRPR